MSNAKPALLMLVHRIPYPPNKGDKIRSFNLLKSLSKTYDIHLGCFYDDDFDQQYISSLNQWCKTVCCLRLPKWLGMIRGLSGFLTNKPITLPYYYQGQMAAWVKKSLQQHAIKDVFVYCSSMAQYVDNTSLTAMHRVIDFVDIDSDKWRQYAAKTQGLKHWFYAREARLLEHYEIAVCTRFNASLFVSEDEANAFRRLISKPLHSKVHSVLNGVDTDFFNPEQLEQQADLPQSFIVFTGAMDYWANVDAVCWFSQHVWPALKKRYPDLQFLIVGGNPSAQVRALNLQPGVIVTGRVKDIRPYIHQALFAIAPMLIARGIQNKVLEAMSMNKAVVCTAMAMEGINAPAGPTTLMADSEQAFTEACVHLLESPVKHNTNRQWILDNFTWQQRLTALNPILAGATAK